MKHTERRPREYLTQKEVDRILAAAAKWSHRDYTMILMAYRHGYRASELCSLRWSQIDLAGALVHVGRLKKSISNEQPLGRDEVKALRKLERETRAESIPYVFYSQRGPMTRNGFWRIVARAGREAGLPWPIHPHMLRHACGYKLANDGRDTRLIQSYLGHAQIQHTVRYTELASGRFDGLWED